MCRICEEDGLQRPARTERWCRGLCWHHARVQGFAPPGMDGAAARSPVRRSLTPGGTPATLCPMCEGEGIRRPAQNARWCRGLCKRHARARGLAPPGAGAAAARSPVRRSPCPDGAPMTLCPTCEGEGVRRPARTERWCRGLCKRHARLRGFTPPDSEGGARAATCVVPVVQGKRSHHWGQAVSDGCGARSNLAESASDACPAACVSARRIAGGATQRRDSSSMWLRQRVADPHPAGADSAGGCSGSSSAKPLARSCRGNSV